MVLWYCSTGCTPVLAPVDSYTGTIYVFIPHKSNPNTLSVNVRQIIIIVTRIANFYNLLQTENKKEKASLDYDYIHLYELLSTLYALLI